MNEQEVIKALDLLAEYNSAKDAMTLSKQELIDSVLTPEIRQKVADIEAEFIGKSADVTENISRLEAEIKNAVKEIGQSVKGKFFHAVWVKGRTSWDTKGLDGYIKAHPELSSFKTEGDPSVSLRHV